MSTIINILNQTGTPLSVSNSVSPSLSRDYWQNLNSSVGTLAHSLEILSFNRNDGISRGKTWVFTTTLTVDGVEVKLEEHLKGTFASSDLEQRMVAGNMDTGFINTGDKKTISFTGNSGADYSLTWDLSMGKSLYDNIEYTLRLVKPAYQKIAPVMPQIDTVVYLMMENRSLDNVLGWLYDGSKPAHVYPEGSCDDFDGLKAGLSNSHEGTKYLVSNGTSGFEQASRVPSYDPHEPMSHVKYQLYADDTGRMPNGDFWQESPAMTGFAWDYYAVYDNPSEVMGAYNVTDLPILNGLAKKFAVSDAWFASMPTQTDPNRAFSVCGTSMGAEDNSQIDKTSYADCNTLFNALGDNGKSWGMYWQSEDFLGTGEPVFSYKPFTSYYFSQINNASNGHVALYTTFYEKIESGTLPNYCFLEPYWGGGKGEVGGKDFIGIQGNDYHPPAWIGPAEYDLNELYNRLVNSPQWSNMLFVISFDEHGGTYDHVSPPKTVAPDDNVGKSGFTFERLGVRVPTILISPFIEEGTVFRAPNGSSMPYDHTSMIATMLKWAGVDPTSAGLGGRVGVAPTFEDVLSDSPRADKPSFTVPEGYQNQGGGTGTIFGLDANEVDTGAVDWHEFRTILDDTENSEDFTQSFNQLHRHKD